MPIDPNSLGDLLPKETIDKLYTDALSPAAKQLGIALEDAAKAGRLLFLPLRALGALHDRIEPMLERIAKRVPEERRIEAAPELVGPALERMRHIPDHSELWAMFEELLTKAVDTKEAAKVHPAFVHIVSQLSGDEARLLAFLKVKPFEIVDTLQLVGQRFENRVVERTDVPLDKLRLPDQMDLYYAHLESLSLVTWPVIEEHPIRDRGTQIGTRRRSTMQLTDFGRLFAEACVPPDGSVGG